MIGALGELGLIFQSWASVKTEMAASAGHGTMKKIHGLEYRCSAMSFSYNHCVQARNSGADMKDSRESEDDVPSSETRPGASCISLSPSYSISSWLPASLSYS